MHRENFTFFYLTWEQYGVYQYKFKTEELAALH
jgi:hypothetical protein